MTSWNYDNVLPCQPLEPWHTAEPQTIPFAGGPAGTTVLQTPDWTSPGDDSLALAFPEISELALLFDQGTDASNGQSTVTSAGVSASASPSTGSFSDAGSFGSIPPPKTVQGHSYGDNASGPSKRKSTAKRHKGSDSKPFKCRIDGCHRRFKLKTDLQKHLGTIRHGGKKTIWCTWCVQGFTRKYNYQRHLRTAHGGG
ncbi:hypothetical protein QBC40DRAFT_258955 [Triangularia verruculosa]|uniref:C2H2-type domain-containing protein n=1 Tax=Triangularia verruculosa TaxID=2587418 RepID=A0AAN6X9G4_9PEZI|nr:hypothetical protein QBC40DRAFT_258955 [Triangularia verruculosa]